jgi:(p)ppGpp synthase/HD superfamily hydrolase
MINEMSIIDKAKDFAQEMHVGQSRKVSKQPYIIHPYRVFQTAVANGYSKDIQLVALLHDTYEDAPNKSYAEEKIKSLFGNKIWLFVKLLSHDSGTDYENYLLQLAKRSNIALTVKLLDMIENLKDNPSPKQKSKYSSSLLYLLNNNVKIDKKLETQIRRLSND